MTGLTLLLTALLASAVTVIHSRPVENDFDAMTYLSYFGYLKRQTNDGTGMDEDEVRQGILDFQFMGNLTQTGVLDAPTMEKMNMPRCGMPDNIGHAMDARRKKRFSLGSKWRNTDLTFRIDNTTPDIPNRADVDATMVAALKVWSDVTPLTFTRVTGNTPADIVISFSPTDRDHGDGNPFDGPSGVLAHAFFPENGDAHFDEGERWTINSFSGINLFQVAAHEFGHSLGLGHSNVQGALMEAFYAGYVPNFQLHSDDILGIQAHYGIGSGGPDVTMAPNPPAPDIPCTGRVDAVTTTRDQSTYIFEGSNVWKFEMGASRISAGFPKSISSTFVGVPDNIDAAFYYPMYRSTFIFKGSQYWRFDNEVMDANFPRSITGDWGLPGDLDAAFVWSGNNQVYFIKGNEYYRYNGRAVDANYPRDLSVWNVPGNQVTAAVQWTNRVTYFFTPSGGYYRYNDRNFRVEGGRGYPAPVASDWQGCANTIEAATPTADSGVSGLAPSLLAMMLPVVLGTTYC
ncbi:matrix metalloproteinase-19-like [Patiria miniata]|uniref:Peptidase metallopeptidase domain-containing protein n=1 Tax=Patiria miniata TaxID=46514 RepID=A0A914AAF4_PATMI|nr:matrix metalloproteinase-19-like [Patiria miniata]